MLGDDVEYRLLSFGEASPQPSSLYEAQMRFLYVSISVSRGM